MFAMVILIGIILPSPKIPVPAAQACLQSKIEMEKGGPELSAIYTDAEKMCEIFANGSCAAGIRSEGNGKMVVLCAVPAPQKKEE